MIVKNNYNECLTNLACSIRKYFGLNTKYASLAYIDELLERKQPKNVVVILFDGMGSRILDRILSKENFFMKNRIKRNYYCVPSYYYSCYNFNSNRLKSY